MNSRHILNLALALLALVASPAQGARTQDEGEDLVEVRVTMLTSDGEQWVGASGVKVLFSGSKAISAWRKGKSLGEDRSTSSALREVGVVAVADEEGVVLLRVPGERLSVLCELHGLETSRNLSSRQVKSGAAELRLVNGYREMELGEARKELLASGENYVTIELLDEEGEPLRYMEAVLLAKVALHDQPGFTEFRSRDVMTGANGRASFPLEQYDQRIVARIGSSEDPAEVDFGPLLADPANYEEVELHVGVFPKDARYLPDPSMWTTRILFDRPMEKGETDVGRFRLSIPPVLLSGVVLDVNGDPAQAVRVQFVGATVGETVIGRGAKSSQFEDEFDFHKNDGGLAPVPGSSRRRATGEDGRFEFRGRLLFDSMESGVTPQRSSKELLEEDHSEVEGTVTIALSGEGLVSREVTFPIGTQGARAETSGAAGISGNVILPEGVSTDSITIIACRPDGSQVGAPFSLDSEGEIRMKEVEHESRDPDGESPSGGLLYDLSARLFNPEIEAGTWDVKFLVRTEYWTRPEESDDVSPGAGFPDPEEKQQEPLFPIIEVSEVEFSPGGSTVDPRLVDLDLRELIQRYTLDVKGPDGEPVPFGFASYRRFGEETAALAIIRDGKAQLVSSSVGLAVHIEAEGCLPAKLPRVWGDQVVQLERAYKVIAKVPDGVEIPSKISPTQGTDFYLELEVDRDEWWRSPVISQVGEGAQGRRRWGETVALDVNGGCLNVHYSQIHSLPGWEFSAVVDASSREGWMFVPAVGGYEGTWSYSYRTRDSGGGSGSGSQIKSSNDGSADSDHFELNAGDVEVRLDIPLTQAGIDSTISQIYERHDWGRWGDLEDDVSEELITEEGVEEGL